MDDLRCSTTSAATPGSVIPSSTNDKESEKMNVSANEETSTHKENEKGEKGSSAGVTQSQAPLPKRRKITSSVWIDFERVVQDDKVTAICKHCGRVFNGSSSMGTSHLNNHKKTCSRRTHKDVGQQLLSMTKSTTSESSKLGNYKFDPELSRKHFARMIAKHAYPFNMAEHEYFQLFVKSLNPLFKFYSRNTVKKDVMDIYQEEKGKIYDELDKLSSTVSFTTDLWISEHQNLGYCVLTCHYIDDEWNLHKRILSYKVLPTPHTGEAISEHIKAQLLDWNLDKKVCSIAVDNASTNDVMVKHVKEWIIRKGALIGNGDIFHVRCCAHILNLIVQDGLVEIKDALTKIRHMVKWINASPSRSEKWKYALSQSRLFDKKSISLDVPTRWNSTYEMLHNALEVKVAFDRLAELDSNFKTLPTEEEWEKCQKIEECLEIFYDVTMNMSGCKYPTANFYFKDVCDILWKIRGWEESKDAYISFMAITMRLKYEKYWKGVSLFMALGAILDPRYKMSLITFCMRRIYENSDFEHAISQIKFDVGDLYAEYVTKYGSSCTQSIKDVSEGVANRKESCDGRSKKGRRHNDDFKKYIAEECSGLMQPPKSELDQYLEESLFPDVDDDSCFDILHWWKINGPKFRILSKMARDILAVPASTVASESAFSIGGRYITESRSLLNPDVVEALICLSDWLPSFKSGPTVDA